MKMGVNAAGLDEINNSVEKSWHTILSWRNMPFLVVLKKKNTRVLASIKKNVCPSQNIFPFYWMEVES